VLKLDPVLAVVDENKRAFFWSKVATLMICGGSSLNEDWDSLKVAVWNSSSS
jgi:hypothetical protein